MERPPDERPPQDAGERSGDPSPSGPQSPAAKGPQSPGPQSPDPQASAPNPHDSDTPVANPTAAPAGSEQETERLPAPVPSPSPYGQYPQGQYEQGYYQQPIYQPVYAPAPKPNGLAIASLVLGILWIYWIGSILALVFGMVGKSQIDKSGGMQSGRGMAIAGIVLGWVGVGFLLLFILFFGGIAGCGALVSS